MTELPEWLANLVGRLVIENEALRRALETQPATNGAVPEADRSPVQ